MKQNEIRQTECYKKSGVNLDNIFEELKKIGVAFYIDSNIFCDDENLKIIDVATNDFNDFQLPLENNSDDPYQNLRQCKLD